MYRAGVRFYHTITCCAFLYKSMGLLVGVSVARA